jgi:hypothetical protein
VDCREGLLSREEGLGRGRLRGCEISSAGRELGPRRAELGTLNLEFGTRKSTANAACKRIECSKFRVPSSKFRVQPAAGASPCGTAPCPGLFAQSLRAASPRTARRFTRLVSATTCARPPIRPRRAETSPPRQRTGRLRPQNERHPSRADPHRWPDDPHRPRAGQQRRNNDRQSRRDSQQHWKNDPQRQKIDRQCRKNGQQPSQS